MEVTLHDYDHCVYSLALLFFFVHNLFSFILYRFKVIENFEKKSTFFFFWVGISFSRIHLLNFAFSDSFFSNQ